MTISAYSDFSETVRFGKERSEAIKAEDNFTMIFKEMKQDLLLLKKLFELKRIVPYLWKSCLTSN